MKMIPVATMLGRETVGLCRGREKFGIKERKGIREEKEASHVMLD